MGAPVVETEKMHCRHWADGLILYYCIIRYFRIRNSKKACPLPPCCWRQRLFCFHKVAYGSGGGRNWKNALASLGWWPYLIILYYCIIRYFHKRLVTRRAADVCYATTRLHMVVETEKKCIGVIGLLALSKPSYIKCIIRYFRIRSKRLQATQ